MAIVSRTAVNSVVPVPLSNRLFSFDEPPYMSLVGGLPDQKLSLSLGLEGPSMLSPLWLLPIYCRGTGGFRFFPSPLLHSLFEAVLIIAIMWAFR